MIVSRCSGDRLVLSNELIKIKHLNKNKKKLAFEDIIKITNLLENHNISELIDNCLIINKKRH